MKIFKILEGPLKGHYIGIMRYKKRGRGMDIEIMHNIPVSKGKGLRWVQTVTGNNVFNKVCKLQTLVDPFGIGDPDVHKVPLPAEPGICKADDLLPFYYTDEDFQQGAGPAFEDWSHLSTPSSGRTWTKFVTALTLVKGKTVHHLVAVTWGFDVMADGSVNVAAVRAPSPAEMQNHDQALKRMYPDFKYTYN